MTRIAGLLSLAGFGDRFDARLLDRMAMRQQHPGFGQPVVENCGPLVISLAATPANDPAAASRHRAHDAARATWAFVDGTLFNRGELERELDLCDRAVNRAASVAELVLAAYARWGEECFARLSGIFAVVLVDQAQRKCMLARDQFGGKPLSYSVLGDQLAFASEYGPLLQLRSDRKANPLALLEFVMHGDILPPATIYEGIFSIPHGHYLLVDHVSAGPQLKRYFNPFDVVEEATYNRLLGLGASRFLDELDACLHQSVKENMADGGPFGVALSGGVDSATLTAIAAKYGDIQALHVSVPEGPKFDERPMAEAVAKHVGVPLVVVVMSPELYRRELVDATLANEMPLWHVQNLGFYLAARRARELGIGALLCGDTIGMMLSPASQLPWGWLHPLLNAASLAPGSLTGALQKFAYALGDLPLNSHGFNWYLPMAVQLTDGYARATQHKQAEQEYSFVRKAARRRIHGAKLAEVHGFYSRFYYRGDRLGNAYGVEYRTPLGDVTALKMAMNLPYEYLVREGTPKWSIKALGSRYIPRNIAFQKKVAWDMPGDAYLSSLASPQLFDDGFCAQAFGLSREAIRANLPSWRAEPHRLSRMIHIELWGRLFIMEESGAQLNDRLAAIR